MRRGHHLGRTRHPMIFVKSVSLFSGFTHGDGLFFGRETTKIVLGTVCLNFCRPLIHLGIPPNAHSTAGVIAPHRLILSVSTHVNKPEVLHSVIQTIMIYVVDLFVFRYCPVVQIPSYSVSKKVFPV